MSPMDDYQAVLKTTLSGHVMFNTLPVDIFEVLINFFEA